jgi:hypothetical protein
LRLVCQRDSPPVSAIIPSAIRKHYPTAANIHGLSLGFAQNPSRQSVKCDGRHQPEDNVFRCGLRPGRFSVAEPRCNG